ncbi:Gfo/Idh/MocA family protein [Chloroflexota bacterium]
MRILVIGYGSIGKRHATNIRATRHEVVLLRHSKDNPNNDGFREYYSFEEAVAGDKIDGAIICSPTSRHFPDVERLVHLRIPFLLEKPPSADLKSTLLMEKLLQKSGLKNYEIGFNLRYYPALKFIKDFLPELGKIYSSRIAAGYYLPYWRKGVDYRETTSASKELGGGVHVELVHEFDYLLWFFGSPERVIGYINRVSNLEISTEDICAALLRYQDGSIVELHLDYLSHRYLRYCQIIAENGTLEWDMNTGGVLYSMKGQETAEEVFSPDTDYDFNDTYIAELENFIGIVNRQAEGKVSIIDAIDTMKVLEAIKISSEKEEWVYLKDI